MKMQKVAIFVKEELKINMLHVLLGICKSIVHLKKFL